MNLQELRESVEYFNSNFIKFIIHSEHLRKLVACAEAVLEASEVMPEEEQYTCPEILKGNCTCKTCSGCEEGNLGYLINNVQNEMLKQCTLIHAKKMLEKDDEISRLKEQIQTMQYDLDMRS